MSNNKVVKKRKTPEKRVSEKKGREEMGRGQVWSIDVLLAVVIFVSVILIFYVTMVPRQKPMMKDLAAESESLKVELENNYEYGFISNDVIDDTKLQAFVNNVTTNYTGLKQKLGVKGEFCIFYEDADGNIIPIIDSMGNSLVGVGNGNISIGGINCSNQLV